MEDGEPRLIEKKLRTLEKRLVEIMTSMGYLKGRSRKDSKITAHIYIHQEATQKTLRKLTGYSMGSVSTTLQALEKQGLVRKHSHPDTREYHYELDGTISQLGFRSLAGAQQYLSQLKGFFGEIEAKLSDPHLSKKKGYENIRRFFDEMNVLIPAYEQVFQKFQTYVSGVRPRLDG